MVTGQGGVALAIATPGDHRQPQSLFQVMRRDFEQELDIQSAIEWPPLRHDASREAVLERRCPLSWDTALTKAGWTVKPVDSWSRLMGGVNGALLSGGGSATILICDR
ncbi:gamma-glutamyltransferase [Bradyrhizobium ottawaense]|uniref:gamma-glutamyltransferase n=1 Tax=Bradyrhizobium ottawaense TaxID=931866 RepID=UPI003F9F26A5